MRVFVCIQQRDEGERKKSMRFFHSPCIRIFDDHMRFIFRLQCTVNTYGQHKRKRQHKLMKKKEDEEERRKKTSCSILMKNKNEKKND